MRRFFLFSILLFSVVVIKAQTKAVTDTGDEVFLYEDGTWTFVEDSVRVVKQIKLNETEFLKNRRSKFQVKSKRLNIGQWLNPKDWTFSNKSTNSYAEFQFKHKAKEIYALLVSEKIQIPVENLKAVAFLNARKSSPDISIVKEEYRIVNGVKVIMMQMAGTVQGMKLFYFGYYYSNSNGSVQLLTYTSQSLKNEYLEDMEVFLNGFVEI